jgi:two-component system CheB/CheR fusion protein
MKEEDETSKPVRPEPSTNGLESGDPTATFPIVGIGASAGGLKALERFFQSLPERPEMAFVVIQHLDPTHKSNLAELLQNHTDMPVEQAEDHITVVPGHVFVIPPGKHLSIRDGILHLEDPDRPRGQRAPIDGFFRSLAEDQGERSACIILSGTGSDGSMGLKSIKESGGVVFVQDPADADHGGMPRSALATGLVDLSAPAGELAEKLVEYHKSADRIRLPEGDDELPANESFKFLKILTQLESQTGHDFSRYKRSTILRRIKRRMQVNQVENMGAYLAHLRNNDREAQALMKNFLISVTNFFRDDQAFDVLIRKVIPQLFDQKSAADMIRVWVPGCATGEEAYSIAMLLYEQMDNVSSSPQVQVFASDLDEDALAFARAGLYPDVIAADISPERLQRFFKQDN